MDRLWRSNSSISSRTGCPPDIVNKEDHNVGEHGASILMCLCDARFKNFKDSILSMINVSLCDKPIYFNCYPDLTLTLDDPNIVKVLTLNIASSGYHMEEGSKPFAYFHLQFWKKIEIGRAHV